MALFKRENTGETININLAQKSIGEGGQGKVCQIENISNYVAKIYNSLNSEQLEKLRVMVDNPPEDPMLKRNHVSIAWPKDLLKDSNGNYIGFIMPRIKDGQTLINVYNPKLREQNAPGFNWFYLYATAQNVAIVIEAIHAKNYVIGDIKAENVLVNPKTLVSIVDTDSFQIRDPHTGKIYRCPVISEEYTPPELLGKDFKNLDRLEIQDRFGLAVIIYHLLFGYHPFSGVWKGIGDEPSLNERISQGHWSHAPKSPISSSHLSMPLNIVHPKVQECFHKCFTLGQENPHLRPNAREWREALELAIKDLADCPKEPGHQYAKNYGKCYWCERKKQLGVDIFPTVSDSSIHTVSKNKQPEDVQKIHDTTTKQNSNQNVKPNQPKMSKKSDRSLQKYKVTQSIATATLSIIISLVAISPVRENFTFPLINNIVRSLQK